ncbi:MAG: TonB-dependent receptor [Ignavibacteriales bacterium]|nr:TonB-dependent receptor [Ignavibacteriales bacterium]
MKKLFLIIVLAASLKVAAQSEQKSIELPDFVITGRQSVEVLSAQKSKPELISTLSKEFFVPQYSPEELPLLIESDLKSVHPSIIAEDFFDGNVNIGVGSQTFPAGEFNLAKSFGNYLVKASAWGKNVKQYIDNAGFNNSGVSLDNEFFIGTKSNFLPGAKIKLSGAYSRESSKFFGSLTPSFERKTDRASAILSLADNYSQRFNFGIDLKGNFFSMEENDLTEKKLGLKPFAAVKFGKFEIGAEGFYQKQILENNLSGVDDYDFYFVNPYLKVSPTKDVILLGGVTYASNSNNTFFSPFGSIQYLVDNGIVLQADYKPAVNNYTVSDFTAKNYYSANGLIDNILNEVNVDLKVSFRFDYEKYFSFMLWSEYKKEDGYLYFEDASQKGIFNVLRADDVKTTSLGINFLMNNNGFGYFMMNAGYNKVTDSKDKLIPYNPKFSADITYGYDFDFGAGAKAVYKFAQDSYANLLNTYKLNSYHNLSLGVYYKLFEAITLSADFQNILNRSNFALRYYEEKPFDIIVGVEYRW